MNIDQEILIALVRDRPVIWDNTTTDYKNKRMKYNAWKDICRKLKPDFDSLDMERRIKFEKLVMKKWTNMKDNWIKYKRKVNRGKCGTKNSRKYLYYDKMLFLKKFIENRKTEYNWYQGDSNDDTSQNGDSAEDTKNNKRECESPKPKENKKVETTEGYESSRSMNFFKGIAPTVDKFNDENMIEFQFQVISVIKDIKQREKDQNRQRTRDQCQDYLNPSSSNMKRSTYGCRSANESGSRSKCRRTSTYDAGLQASSSFMQPAKNRNESHVAEESNDDDDEHPNADHRGYFLPSNDEGAHLMDNVGMDIQEHIMKIETVEDSLEKEDELNSEYEISDR